MKRLLFWLFVGLVIIVGLRALRLQHSTLHGPRPWTVYRSAPAPYQAPHPASLRVEVDDDDETPVRRETVDDLPVPVIPESRTTEARIEPPRPPGPPPPPRRKGHKGRAATANVRFVEPASNSSGLLVTGRLSANPERAKNDARATLEQLVAERIAPDVPTSWRIPPRLIDSMIRQVIVRPYERDYGTVYEASLRVDVSRAMRSRIIAAYRHEEVMKRLAVAGAVLLFVLACLAALSGYIKADEATKGYYTTRLRLAAATGVGAAAVALYHWLT